MRMWFSAGTRMVDTPAMMALVVKNTKLMGTTSVASNTFMASLRNLWRDEREKKLEQQQQAASTAIRMLQVNRHHYLYIFIYHHGGIFEIPPGRG